MAEHTEYTKAYLEEYNPEILSLSKELNVSHDDPYYLSLIRVFSNLFKSGDYEFNKYISVIVKAIVTKKVTYCNEIIDKVGFVAAPTVVDPFVTIYPELFYIDNNFDVTGYGDVLTCISESINNLMKLQKYTDIEVKKKLLNYKPLKIILVKTNTKKLPERDENIMVARTYFQLISCSCFHATKHGAYPFVTESDWIKGNFVLNGKSYTVKDLSKKYPEFTWSSVLKSIMGDKSLNLRPVYPANQIFLSGDYLFMG